MSHSCSTSFCLLLLVFAITLLAATAFCQNTVRDVVYLKNGSIIKGLIIEQIPNKSLKIQTADGSIFVYQFSEVDKIEKESTIVPQLTYQDQNVPQAELIIFGGAAIPSGDFASTSGQSAGYAKTGYGFGLQFDSFLPNSIFWSLSFNVDLNPVDQSAVRQAFGVSSAVSTDISSYSAVSPMVGFGFYSSSNPGVLIYLQGQIGIMFGSSPDIKISSGSLSLTQSSSTAAAFSYGFEADLTIGGEVSFSVRYMTAQPKYKIIASSGVTSVTGDIEQPTGLFQICAGITM